MSLKKRFILFTVVFTVLAGLFLALIESQTDEVKSIRRHIKDDWAEAKLLFNVTVLLGQLHALCDYEDEIDLPRIDHLLDYYGQLHADLAAHAARDVTNKEGELKELAALDEIRANMDDWRILRYSLAELAKPERQREATRLYQEGSVAVTDFSRGAWEEMDESLAALGRSESEIERMTLHWAAGMLGLLAIAWLGFVYWLMRPISRLRRMVRRFRDHKFAVPDGISESGEVGELTRSFVEMAEELHRFTTNLESLVAERTQELESSRAALASAQKLAAIGRLSSGIAHEINNPLTAIGACAEGLMKRIQNGSVDHELFESYLRTIHDEVYRCKDITEKLLDFSRQRAEMPTILNLSDIAIAATRLVEPLALKKNVRIQVDAHIAISVYSFGHAVRQVLLNLLMNAIEACEPEGNVHVRVMSTEEEALIEISDDGVGITEEVLPHLFEPFFTRRRDNSGTGLGLFVCQGIVQALGGSLIPTSGGAGQGAAFTLHLPLRKSNETELVPREEATSHA